MPRLARGRKTHLTPEEIAAEALRQFDRGEEPSIRSLAAALGVAPTAIYHHFDSRSAIVDAAIGLVWREASREGYRLLEAGDSADPTELLVFAALATRRAFGNHHQIAPYIASTAGASEQLAANLGLLAGAFEALGLEGEDAGRAFHAYGSFAVGSTLVLAARLNRGGDEKPDQAAAAAEPAADTRRALEAMIDLSHSDPARDEELFVDGLRRLIASFAPS